MKKIFFFLSFMLILTSCGDDDICLGEESTPRMKLKFRNANNQLVQLDSLYVDVNYGKTLDTNILVGARLDSIFVPLRIDENPYTDFYIRTRKNDPKSKIRIYYDAKSIYVSPPCGFKRNYENLRAELLETGPVQSIQSNQTSLTDETRINFYLRF